MQTRYSAAVLSVATWTIVSAVTWFVLLFIVQFVAANTLPFRVATSASYLPASGGYRRIEVDSVSEIPAGDDIASTASVTLTLTNQVGTAVALSLQVDDVDQAAARIVAPGAVSASIPLDNATLLRWMSEADIDISRAGVRAEAEEVILIIHGLAAGPKGSPPGNLQHLTLQTIRSGPRQLLPGWLWMNWLPLALAITLWFAGMFWIARISSRRIS